MIVIAINLYDLMSLQVLDPVGALLFPPSIIGEVIAAESRRVAQDAAILKVDEERAEAIVTLVRKKYKKKQLLMYRSKTGRGGWKRI